METLMIKELNEDIRIDKYLCDKYDVSRGYIKKHFDEEMVLVNGKAVKPSYKLKVNDQIEIEFLDNEELNIEPQDLNLEFVYQDNDIAIVNKPKGMVTHIAPGAKDKTLVNGLLFALKDSLSTINGVKRPGIVHRIDKDTSGLLVISKNDYSHQELAKQFAVHSVTRTYYAIVHGVIKENKGVIDAPIGRDPNSRLRMAVIKDGKRAVTHFEVLERFKDATFIKCNLETGRTHQIRVHLKYIGHPLFGDQVYGPHHAIVDGGQVLHAKTLGFIHPTTKQYVEFDSELPDYFKELLEDLRIK